MDSASDDCTVSSTLSNVFACSGPRFELDYDASIVHCRNAFEKMFPGEEFLPRKESSSEIHFLNSF
jgi:hypothetical protein